MLPAMPPPLTGLVLRVLAYFDIFHYPLASTEVRCFCDDAQASLEAVEVALEWCVANALAESFEGFYALQEVAQVVAARREHNAAAERLLPVAVGWAQRVARLPFVRGVCLSGSISKQVMTAQSDLDLFITTPPRRAWLARSVVYLYTKLPAQRGADLCPNYYVDSEQFGSLERNLFTAMELATLLPVCDPQAHAALLAANPWVQAFLPNHPPVRQDLLSVPRRPWWARVVEGGLAGRGGDLLNHGLMCLTWRRWRRRDRRCRELEGCGAVRVRAGIVKSHFSDWQNRILAQYATRVRGLEQASGIRAGEGMPRLLFSHSYFYRLDAKQWAMARPYPPLGTLYAAAAAREQGYPVALFDTNLAESDLEIVPVLERERPDIVVFYDDGFNYLTKMCLSTMRAAALRMIQRARERGCRVIVCSSDATDHPQIYLDQGADAVILGEGEETLGELLERLRQGRPMAEVVGVAYRNEAGGISVNAKRPVLRDLDALPPPAWDLVDLTAYRAIWLQHHGYFSLNLATTRGCPYQCSWCAKPLWGRRYNARSPEAVVAEIALLLEHYGPQHFWICDDIFGLKPGWLPRFAQLVAAQGLRFRYTIQSRADLLLEEGVVEALAASGAELVWLGAESGSQKILDAMNKGIRVEQIHAATHRLRAHGIKVALFLQFGYLGELREDIDQTLAMLFELMPDDLGISVSYPLPGTPFFDQVREALGGKTHWSDSSDLAMMFNGTYRTDYYRALHRYVHNRFRARTAARRLRARLQQPSLWRLGDLRLAAGGALHLLRAGWEWQRLLRLERYGMARQA